MAMGHRNVSPNFNSSIAIKQEIQRFESVHPSIYSIYDLIELIEDIDLRDRIRDHVICIEDSFVNSEEWTLSRNVSELKLGVVGHILSGKSALVHRYLTGSYMQDESPEGGRFKKEVMLDNQSNLLLIRDEGRPPDPQFTAWVDAVVFVFSLENQDTFDLVYNYHARMSQFRNLLDIPLILVGTQDAISEFRPRSIDDAKARKCAHDLKRCSYYETCATYGHNVERVFQDACQKIVQNLMSTRNSRPTTPQTVGMVRGMYAPHPPVKDTSKQKSTGASSMNNSVIPSSNKLFGSNQLISLDNIATPEQQQQQMVSPIPNNMDFPMPPPHNYPLASSHQQSGKSVKKSDSLLRDKVEESLVGCIGLGSHHHQQYEYSTTYASTPSNNENQPVVIRRNATSEKNDSKQRDEATPSGTPTQSRKNRRRSNLFTNRPRDDEKKTPITANSGSIGSGRTIPVKQGLLYKKSKNSLNREWKKKYVTLTEEGRLTYHPNLQNYMDNQHGKDIDLSRTTVKIPGQLRPTSNGLLKTHPSVNGVSNQDSADSQKKRRHKRARSGGRHLNDSQDDVDSFEFMIVSLDNRSWHFEAQSGEERDDWVREIESCIMRSLQGGPPAQVGSNQVPSQQVASLSALFGNNECADCSKSNPEWASLNLGNLLCIECSGIHRQLGTHLSRVRSLTLDEWSPHHMAVMHAVGNKLANSVWEARLALQAGATKPGPDSSREDKEAFIQAKYERREFLPDLPFKDSPVQQQLIDAIARYDTRQVILCLAVAGTAVNKPYSKQDPRAAIHIAATLGQIHYLQLLLWYSADINVTDHEGRNAYFYASAAGMPECADFLLRQGCVANPNSSAAATLPRRRSKTQPGQSTTTEIGL